MIHNSKISIVAAIGKNRELGKDNKLLWNIPEDLKRFREITSGHPIIMGRKTFESIGRPLPNRLNIVITRNQEFPLRQGFEGQAGIKNQENLVFVSSLKEAIEEGSKYYVVSSKEKASPTTNYNLPTTENEIFIIGGGQIFEQALPMTDRIYLTVVDKAFEADTFFPEYNQFKKTMSKESGESNGYTYSFLVLER